MANAFSVLAKFYFAARQFLSASLPTLDRAIKSQLNLGRVAADAERFQGFG